VTALFLGGPLRIDTATATAWCRFARVAPLQRAWPWLGGRGQALVRASKLAWQVDLGRASIRIESICSAGFQPARAAGKNGGTSAAVSGDANCRTVSICTRSAGQTVSAVLRAPTGGFDRGEIRFGASGDIRPSRDCVWRAAVATWTFRDG
jgi:hypothetical protein